MEDNNIIFKTSIGDNDYRIRQVTDDDCIVEVYTPWDAKYVAVDNDSGCAHVYMLCCLEQQKIIDSFGNRKFV
jgi:hypothetical protein